MEEKPGVTRDRKEFSAEWAGRSFILIDTGGWAVGGEELMSGIRHQAEAALSAADVVLFVADGTTSLSDDDFAMARLVQRSGVPHLLVANKVDGPHTELDLGHLWGLGLSGPQPVSALHGRGAGDLLDMVVSLLPDADVDGEEQDPGMAVMAILGRPNVGKSTPAESSARRGTCAGVTGAGNDS